MFDVETHRSIRDFSADSWNALLGCDAEPYLKWEFLEALEATGCVGPEAGWIPLPLAVREAGRLQAVAPAYVKGNSDGEFVFDHSWARFAYERLGVDYYPKLVLACPFTPATGRRILTSPGADPVILQRAMARGIELTARQLKLSSAHVLFPRAEEANRWQEAGFALRLGVQFHWRNDGYQSFDDFLARYNAKRRHQIRRERSEVHKQGLELVAYTGSDLTPEVLDAAFEFYKATVEKYYWGRQYLNRDFFIEIGHRLRHDVLVILARERSSRKPIAGAFNLMGNQRLFGRYWGATGEYRHLHFNVCYYEGIAQCIERKLSVFEPGAGGEHKVVRGFEPTLTYSAHLLDDERLDRAVRDYLAHESDAVKRAVEGDAGIFKASPEHGGKPRRMPG